MNNEISNDLGMPTSLNKRKNEGGIVLTEEISNNENIEFNEFLTSMPMNLMRGIPVEEENYTKTII